jgi:hypothetical protein
MYQIAYRYFLKIFGGFDKVQLQFRIRIRIRIHDLKLWIRILQKVSNPDPQYWLKIRVKFLPGDGAT